VDGAKARFRPILLTSMTTFLGVAPLIFEQSTQAQFLIPMAAALGFGILFATLILMLMVPALATLQARAEAAWQRWRSEGGEAEEGDRQGAPAPAGEPVTVGG
jgi:Cu/Ag efflux pump CusA